MSAQCACSCKSETRIVMTCAGASNVGQIANEAGKRLAMDGDANYACLAGVSGGVSGVIASVKGADKLLIIDGCPMACAKKTVDAAGISGYRHQIVTDTGVKKVHDFQLDDADIQKTVTVCRAKLNE